MITQRRGAAGVMPVASQGSTTAEKRKERSSSFDASKLLFFVALVCTNLVTYRIAKTSMPAGNEEDIAQSMIPLDCTLGIPVGKAQALPSVRVEDKIDRSIDKKSAYGGRGDKQHLGGFTDIDLQGISPAVWKFMVETVGVRSLLDLGCGRGISTVWFLKHGVDALCVEGSHDAAEQTMLPDPSTQMVEHDYSRGPWWPAKTYDVIWCVEFLEHVGRNYHHNYLPTMRKAGLLFVTHSIWGGWHHVEVHSGDWWIRKFELYGFVYAEKLTNQIRFLARTERKANITAPNGQPYRAVHIHSNLHIFINPAVTALPEHSHLFHDPGCFAKRENKRTYTRECEDKDGETALPDNFKPLNITQQQDEDWFDWVKQRINH